MTFDIKPWEGEAMYRNVDQRIVADRLEYLRSQASPRRRVSKNRRRHPVGRKVGHVMIRVGLRLAHDDAQQRWRLVMDQ
jgi:hypothetical protein